MPLTVGTRKVPAEKRWRRAGKMLYDQTSKMGMEGESQKRTSYVLQAVQAFRSSERRACRF